MAISYVASGGGANSGTIAATSGTLTIAPPAGIQANDILKIVIAITDTGAAVATPPTGWLLAGAAVHQSGLTELTYLKVATGSEPANYSFPWTAGSTALASCVIDAYRGASIKTPFTTWTGAHGTGTSATPAAAITAHANDWVDFDICSAVATAPSTPGGYNSRTSYNPGTVPAILTCDTAQASQGTTGAPASTVGSGGWAVRLLCLTPTDSVAFIGSASNAASGTNPSVTNPPGSQQGDFVMVRLLGAGSQLLSPNNVTPPSGWAVLQSAGSWGVFPHIVFYKYLGAGEPASWSFTCPVAVPWEVLVYRNVNFVDAQSVRGGNSSIASAAAATTNDPNEVVVYLEAQSATVAPNPSLTGWMNHYTTTDGSTHGLGAWDQPQVSAGATAAPAAGMNTTTDYTAVLITLSPTVHPLWAYIRDFWYNDAAGTASPYTVKVPAQAQVGDTLIMVVQSNAAPTTPTGWTLVRNDTNQWTYSRPCQVGGAGSSVSVTATGTTAINGQCYAIAQCGGVDNSAGSHGAGSGAASTPSMTPNTSQCLILYLFGNWATGTSTGAMEGFTNPNPSPPGLFAGKGSKPSGTAGAMGEAIKVRQTGAATVVASSALTATPATSNGWAGTVLSLLVGNHPPDAPTALSPTGLVAVDRTVTQRLSWIFSDPDVGDSQSAFDLQWRHQGTVDAWNVVSQATPNNYLDVASGTFPAENIEWQVRTYDQSGVVGPWSALSYFTAASPPAAPTITSPISGGTISADSTTVDWSAAAQDAYQLRRVADSAGSADTATVYYDTGEVDHAGDRSAPVPFETNNRFEHIEVRAKSGGLWSSWTDIRVDVSYTPPAMPTLTVSANDANASITVSPSQPAPSGGQPTVTSIDIYRRQTSVGGGGIRVAAAVPPTAPWTDYTPASGVDYEYQVVALGANITSTPSAWTD